MENSINGLPITSTLNSVKISEKNAVADNSDDTVSKNLNDNIKKYDTDNDGKISKAEMYKASCIYFNKLNNKNTDELLFYYNEIKNISKCDDVSLEKFDVIKSQIQNVLNSAYEYVNNSDLSAEEMTKFLLNIKNSLSIFPYIKFKEEKCKDHVAL